MNVERLLLVLTAQQGSDRLSITGVLHLLTSLAAAFRDQDLDLASHLGFPEGAVVHISPSHADRLADALTRYIAGAREVAIDKDAWRRIASYFGIHEGDDGSVRIPDVPTVNINELSADHLTEISQFLVRLLPNQESQILDALDDLNKNSIISSVEALRTRIKDELGKQSVDATTESILTVSVKVSPGTTIRTELSLRYLGEITNAMREIFEVGAPRSSRRYVPVTVTVPMDLPSEVHLVYSEADQATAFKHRVRIKGSSASSTISLAGNAASRHPSSRDAEVVASFVRSLALQSTGKDLPEVVRSSSRIVVTAEDVVGALESIAEKYYGIGESERRHALRSVPFAILRSGGELRPYQLVEYLIPGDPDRSPAIREIARIVEELLPTTREGALRSRDILEALAPPGLAGFGAGEMDYAQEMGDLHDMESWRFSEARMRAAAWQASQATLLSSESLAESARLRDLTTSLARISPNFYLGKAREIEQESIPYLEKRSEETLQLLQQSQRRLEELRRRWESIITSPENYEKVIASGRALEIYRAIQEEGSNVRQLEEQLAAMKQMRPNLQEQIARYHTFAREGPAAEIEFHNATIADLKRRLEEVRRNLQGYIDIASDTDKQQAYIQREVERRLPEEELRYYEQLRILEREKPFWERSLKHLRKQSRQLKQLRTNVRKSMKELKPAASALETRPGSLRRDFEALNAKIDRLKMMELLKDEEFKADEESKAAENLKKLDELRLKAREIQSEIKATEASEQLQRYRRLSQQHDDITEQLTSIQKQVQEIENRLGAFANPPSTEEEVRERVAESLRRTVDTDVKEQIAKYRREEASLEATIAYHQREIEQIRQAQRVVAQSARGSIVPEYNYTTVTSSGRPLIERLEIAKRIEDWLLREHGLLASSARSTESVFRTRSGILFRPVKLPHGIASSEVEGMTVTFGELLRQAGIEVREVRQYNVPLPGALTESVKQILREKLSKKPSVKKPSVKRSVASSSASVVSWETIRELLGRAADLAMEDKHPEDVTGFIRDVERAFGEAVGEDNASRALQDVRLRKLLFGIVPEEAQVPTFIAEPGASFLYEQFRRLTQVDRVVDLIAQHLEGSLSPGLKEAFVSIEGGSGKLRKALLEIMPPDDIASELYVRTLGLVEEAVPGSLLRGETVPTAAEGYLQFVVRHAAQSLAKDLERQAIERLRNEVPLEISVDEDSDETINRAEQKRVVDAVSGENVAQQAIENVERERAAGKPQKAYLVSSRDDILRLLRRHKEVDRVLESFNRYRTPRDKPETLKFETSSGTVEIELPLAERGAISEYEVEIVLRRLIKEMQPWLEEENLRDRPYSLTLQTSRGPLQLYIYPTGRISVHGSVVTLDPERIKVGLEQVEPYPRSISLFASEVPEEFTEVPGYKLALIETAPERHIYSVASRTSLEQLQRIAQTQPSHIVSIDIETMGPKLEMVRQIGLYLPGEEAIEIGFESVAGKTPAQKELNLLVQFSEAVSRIFEREPERRLAGYNIAEFDIPLLLRRLEGRILYLEGIQQRGEREVIQIPRPSTEEETALDAALSRRKVRYREVTVEEALSMLRRAHEVLGSIREQAIDVYSATRMVLREMSHITLEDVAARMLPSFSGVETHRALEDAQLLAQVFEALREQITNPKTEIGSLVSRVVQHMEEYDARKHVLYGLGGVSLGVNEHIENLQEIRGRVFRLEGIYQGDRDYRALLTELDPTTGNATRRAVLRAQSLQELEERLSTAFLVAEREQALKWSSARARDLAMRNLRRLVQLDKGDEGLEGLIARWIRVKILTEDAHKIQGFEAFQQAVTGFAEKTLRAALQGEELGISTFLKYAPGGTADLFRNEELKSLIGRVYRYLMNPRYVADPVQIAQWREMKRAADVIMELTGPLLEESIQRVLAGEISSEQAAELFSDIASELLETELPEQHGELLKYTVTPTTVQESIGRIVVPVASGAGIRNVVGTYIRAPMVLPKQEAYQAARAAEKAMRSMAQSEDPLLQLLLLGGTRNEELAGEVLKLRRLIEAVRSGRLNEEDVPAVVRALGDRLSATTLEDLSEGLRRLYAERMSEVLRIIRQVSHEDLKRVLRGYVVGETTSPSEALARAARSLGGARQQWRPIAQVAHRALKALERLGQAVAQIEESIPSLNRQTATHLPRYAGVEAVNYLGYGSASEKQLKLWKELVHKAARSRLAERIGAYREQYARGTKQPRVVGGADYLNRRKSRRARRRHLQFGTAEFVATNLRQRTDLLKALFEAEEKTAGLDPIAARRKLMRTLMTSLGNEFVIGKQSYRVSEIRDLIRAIDLLIREARPQKPDSRPRPLTLSLDDRDIAKLARLKAILTVGASTKYDTSQVLKAVSKTAQQQVSNQQATGQVQGDKKQPRGRLKGTGTRRSTKTPGPNIATPRQAETHVAAQQPVSGTSAAAARRLRSAGHTQSLLASMLLLGAITLLPAVVHRSMQLDTIDDGSQERTPVYIRDRIQNLLDVEEHRRVLRYADTRSELNAALNQMQRNMKMDMRVRGRDKRDYEIRDEIDMELSRAFMNRSGGGIL